MKRCKKCKAVCLSTFYHLQHPFFHPVGHSIHMLAFSSDWRSFVALFEMQGLLQLILSIFLFEIVILSCVLGYFQISNYWLIGFFKILFVHFKDVISLSFVIASHKKSTIVCIILLTFNFLICFHGFHPLFFCNFPLLFLMLYLMCCGQVRIIFL